MCMESGSFPISKMTGQGSALALEGLTTEHVTDACAVVKPSLRFLSERDYLIKELLRLTAPPNGGVNKGPPFLR